MSFNFNFGNFAENAKAFEQEQKKYENYVCIETAIKLVEDQPNIKYWKVLGSLWLREAALTELRLTLAQEQGEKPDTWRDKLVEVRPATKEEVAKLTDERNPKAAIATIEKSDWQGKWIINDVRMTRLLALSYLHSLPNSYYIYAVRPHCDRKNNTK